MARLIKRAASIDLYEKIPVQPIIINVRGNDGVDTNASERVSQRINEKWEIVTYLQCGF